MRWWRCKVCTSYFTKSSIFSALLLLRRRPFSDDDDDDDPRVLSIDRGAWTALKCFPPPVATLTTRLPLVQIARAYIISLLVRLFVFDRSIVGSTRSSEAAAAQGSKSNWGHLSTQFGRSSSHIQLFNLVHRKTFCCSAISGGCPPPPPPPWAFLIRSSSSSNN